VRCGIVHLFQIAPDCKVLRGDFCEVGLPHCSWPELGHVVPEPLLAEVGPVARQRPAKHFVAGGIGGQTSNQGLTTVWGSFRYSLALNNDLESFSSFSVVRVAMNSEEVRGVTGVRGGW